MRGMNKTTLLGKAWKAPAYVVTILGALLAASACATGPSTGVSPSGAQAVSRWSVSSLLLNRLPKGPHYGILARFATPADLYHACERVRDAGFTRWDAHTPFPVHGLEGAMGIRRSLLPWIVLVAGLTGAAP